MTELKLCSHTHDNGEPCRAIPVKNTPYCYFHRKYYNPPALPGDRNYVAPLLESHESILLAATHLNQSLLAGKMTEKQVALSLNLLRLAAKAIAAIEKAKNQKEKERERERTEDLGTPVASDRPTTDRSAAKAATMGGIPSASKRSLTDLARELEPMMVELSESDSTTPPDASDRKPPQPAYQGDRIVDPYGCLSHLKG